MGSCHVVFKDRCYTNPALAAEHVGEQCRSSFIVPQHAILKVAFKISVKEGSYRIGLNLDIVDIKKLDYFLSFHCTCVQSYDSLQLRSSTNRSTNDNAYVQSNFRVGTCCH